MRSTLPFISHNEARLFTFIDDVFKIDFGRGHTLLLTSGCGE